MWDKAVEEFADMYGMNPDEVSQALERSRADEAAAQALKETQATQETQAIETETAEAAQAQAPANTREAP